MAGFFSHLLQRIFGTRDTAQRPVSSTHVGSTAPEGTIRGERADGAQPQATGESARDEKQIETPITESRSEASQTSREPYFFQIGLDFGTAFMKCVIRDVIKDRAWVYCPEGAVNRTQPYLMPSRVTVSENRIKFSQDQSAHYAEGTIGQVKMALAAASTGRMTDPSLELLRRALAIAEIDQDDFHLAAQACCTLLVGSVLDGVRAEIKKRYPDFSSHPDDYLAVNMAIPVANMETREVREAFDTVLRTAWHHSGAFSSPDGIDIREIMSLLRAPTPKPELEEFDPCYLYPEVSANVQGYVRSRSSKPGLFLFSDVGAGTVDQSIFFFSRDGGEHVAYQEAQVLPLGSAEIERRAALHAEPGNGTDLETLRRRKESGTPCNLVKGAQNDICGAIDQETVKILTRVKTRRLYRPQQIREIELIFAGGGYAEHPYKTGVLRAFQNQIFANPLSPPSIGLPPPTDLEMPGNIVGGAYSRLAVAYGLSFHRGDLSPFILPCDQPTPRRIPPPRREPPHFVSKDDC